MIHDELVRNKIQTSYKNVPVIMFFDFFYFFYLYRGSLSNVIKYVGVMACFTTECIAVRGGDVVVRVMHNH